MQFISLVPTLFSWWYGRGLSDLFRFLAALFSSTKEYERFIKDQKIDSMKLIKGLSID